MDVLKLIPQLFFDLISRVIPGSIAIVLISIAADIKLGKATTDFSEGVRTLQDSALVLGLGFLIAAYLFGQIISPISDLIETRIVRRLFRAKCQVLKDAISSDSEYPPAVRNLLIREMGVETEDANSVKARQYSQAVFLWYDWLRVNNPDAGDRVAKMRAEYRMHSQNAVALFISLAVHLTTIIACPHKGNFKIAFIVVVVLASLASLWANARAYQTFQRAVIHLFYSAKVSGNSAIARKS
jgi:hypothetical protein